MNKLSTAEPSSSAAGFPSSDRSSAGLSAAGFPSSDCSASGFSAAPPAEPSTDYVASPEGGTCHRSAAPKARVVVIGAGAAGCFCAAELARRRSDVRVTVLEAGRRPLAKVAITGGGRCNLTNSFAQISDLRQAYPRGAQLMKRCLSRFDQLDTCKWFESRGVPLVLQDDECVFPRSQDAMQIVRTLERSLRLHGVDLLCSHRVTRILDLGITAGSALSAAAGPVASAAGGARYLVRWAGPDGTAGELEADAVVLTAGGKSRSSLAAMLPSDIALTPTVPSLFTLNIDDAPLKSLMGAVIEGAVVSLAGTKFKAGGPLLITDWGVSGPAILKISSYAAKSLSDSDYRGTLLISWLGTSDQEAISAHLRSLARDHSRKLLLSTPPASLAASHAPVAGFGTSAAAPLATSVASQASQGCRLSSRVWQHIIARAGLREDIRWAELGAKGLARLVATLASDAYPISGRCHFKGEFVTCGGVALEGVNSRTLSSKLHPGLYFAGEVLDIDAITGGFNLQAAWSTGWCVADSLAYSLACLDS